MPNTEVATKEPRARITFLLTFSGRALRQIKRLIKSLFHKDHYFLIHVDAVSTTNLRLQTITFILNEIKIIIKILLDSGLFVSGVNIFRKVTAECEINEAQVRNHVGGSVFPSDDTECHERSTENELEMGFYYKFIGVGFSH